MSTIINIAIPRSVAEPRGAIWVGQFAESLRAFFKPGATVASAEEGKRNRDAAAVRSYANSLRDVDPGMAADLHAALDRDAR